MIDFHFVSTLFYCFFPVSKCSLVDVCDFQSLFTFHLLIVSISTPLHFSYNSHIFELHPHTKKNGSTHTPIIYSSYNCCHLETYTVPNTLQLIEIKRRNWNNWNHFHWEIVNNLQMAARINTMAVFLWLSLLYSLHMLYLIQLKMNLKWYFADCYSSLEEQNCVRTGTVNDTIFWQRKCTDISTICSNFQLQGVNASYCRNDTTNEHVPIRSLIKRTLASEEYY